MKKLIMLQILGTFHETLVVEVKLCLLQFEDIEKRKKKKNFFFRNEYQMKPGSEYPGIRATGIERAISWK